MDGSHTIDKNNKLYKFLQKTLHSEIEKTTNFSLKDYFSLKVIHTQNLYEGVVSKASSIVWLIFHKVNECIITFSSNSLRTLRCGYIFNFLRKSYKGNHRVQL